MIHEENAPKGEHLVLTPKVSFALGLVGGILVICTVGFFILLGIMLKGGLPTDSADATVKTDTVVADDTQPSAPAAAPEEDKVGEVAPVTSSDYVSGSAKAPVTLITYSDYECPFCSRFHSTMKQVMEEYSGKVRWVYRNFPLSFHASANSAALAALCAGEQGKFWEYSDKLFENQSSLSDANFSLWAKDLKLSSSKFDSCMSSKKYQSRIDADKSSGTKAGVSGTPGTIIIYQDGETKKLIPGALPLESVKSMIDAALE